MLNSISCCWLLPWVHPTIPAWGIALRVTNRFWVLTFFHVFTAGSCWIIMCVPLQTCFPCLLLFAVRSASSSNSLESELQNHLESIRVAVRGYQNHLEEALGKLRDSNVSFLQSCRYIDYMEVLFINGYLVLGINVCCIGRIVKINNIFSYYFLVSYFKKESYLVQPQLCCFRCICVEIYVSALFS